ncbi:acetyl-CoA carboxylase biotin carboxylase subunit [Oceanobacillus rekensis]|uniref:acetyl-CoA carboxylase biotin carboxylase subunit n=1 Tax=Oceanobacillus rekensis TaxID=937927 RepID=UPI000B449A1F|nr:acetyl-CoA carboxylase biotin carboxylase subunit [Oceanobacillus rekensis]
MINKILVANRGEIAARIIRTCKMLDIKTVAIYSEADKDSPYVKMAEESFLIGPPNVNESYLNINKILSVAKEAKVDAIHPGYGFLSENGKFADSCRKEGIIFIGPSSKVIEKMGDKIVARSIMKDAGVPVIPGTEGAVASVEDAINLAKEINYPIMLKASAGGGGIGMEVVHSDEELEKAFESNLKKSQRFFGDGSMFLEKKIENAHHIEIQLLADNFGNVVHLYERECSIQRRNQKVIEEAPSIFISEETRKKMGSIAVQAAKVIGYTGAGTIEFLVDEENFYFLEMNTRLQVEHPVTEEITGVDIVEAQIKIAENKTLPFNQDEIVSEGHSVEVRIYAEDPVRFFPSPGLITKVEFPEGESIRNETAITNNYTVSPYYDPMIGKLIVKGSDRKQAISILKDALMRYNIEGIKTNIPMILEIINNEIFQAGQTTTDFVEKHYLPVIKK